MMRSTLLILVLTSHVFGQAADRTIAVTIDDLPVVSTRRDFKNREEITRKLPGHIRKAKIPAIGFVNENKLYTADKRDEEQIDLLRMWLDAGLELGNHTFSHRSLNTIPLSDLPGRFVERRGGYEKALKDEGYKLPDTYVGPAGISWLHRWARERGREYVLPDEPKVPEFVLKASGFDSE